MLITQNGMIVRIAAGTVRKTARNTQGVRVIKVASGDTLIGVARVADEDGDDAAEDNTGDVSAPEAES